ncbi:MAG: glycoside hydrolase family 3 C-terminal domain-containing protein [Hyphomonadaceae bacterium]|nr:glycoside hydrolase family 3 C-terminal domain-containing protein [Hyphomonadaceae bacterium]
MSAPASSPAAVEVSLPEPPPELADLPIAAQATAMGLTGETRVDYILARLSVEQKLGQLNQIPGGRSKNLNSRIDESEYARIRAGAVGSYLHVAGAEFLGDLQTTAVEDTPHGIPLLFAMDVVHGYRTLFPVPLAMAASFDTDAAETAAAIAADEASASGLHWTFAPMVDIARDARWGRVVEGAGEEPYLGAEMSAAQVRGFQGTDLAAGNTVLATTKHFGAYGAGIGGRDYETADISERTLREVYLPPFEAAADAGTGSFMVAFNDIAGVPTTANSALLNGVLRGEWGYDGVLISDWNSIAELMAHGVAETEEEAGALALTASVDMEMTSGIYASALAERVKADPALQTALDASAKRVLMAKEALGLFDDPMAYHDGAREAASLLSDAHRAAAREIAARSAVLLKNEGQLLPLGEAPGRVGIIGALAEDGLTQLGSWRAQGRAEDVVTILDALEERLPGATTYTPGANTKDPADPYAIAEAVAVAETSDVVVLVIGEDFDMSGEARAMSSVALPAPQLELAEAVFETGKPVVVVLVNGRPVDLTPIAEKADAILETWMLGVEAGPAVADLLFGNVSPGGRLPASFPRTTGQLPYYMAHNPTGRPADPDLSKDTARYVDIPITPLYAFGHGLTYSDFTYGGLTLSATEIGQGGTVDVSLEITNTGDRTADEVVQLYMRDPHASIARPVQELRGFKRITLAPGQRSIVTFTLTPEQFAFYGAADSWVVEAGKIELMVGAASDDIRQRAVLEITESFETDGSAAAILTPITVEPTLATTYPTIGEIVTYSDGAEDVFAPGARIEKLTDDLFVWSEGPVWVPSMQAVLFSDVPENTIYKWTERGAVEVFLMPSGYDGPSNPAFREPGSNGLILSPDGNLLMGDHGNRAIAALDLETKEKTLLATEFEGNRFSSPNDLVLAGDGAIFFTDPPYGLAGMDESPIKETPVNGVYRRAEDGTITLVDGELTRPNGVILSPDGQTLYVAQSDPQAAQIFAYDVASDGSVSNKRVFADLTEFVGEAMPGLPDGMAMDVEGRLFATGPGGVRVFSPDGELLALISTGTAAANVTFGEDGRTLFITSGDFLARVRVATKGLGF